MTAATDPTRLRGRGVRRTAVAAVHGSKAGLIGLAIVVGAGAGLGAVLFRELVNGLTWVFTGAPEFGQRGWVPSAHVPWLGLGFFVLAPAVGGLVYGPLVHRYAPEARGHGVPEVMAAVAENGGRIRWQVALVKSLASALTIGSGGSVGREGPIVQIGSALASTLGQWSRVPENRLRILVACGAGGGIAATFDAPITGVFFAAEIILRELSAEAMFAVMTSAMVADAVAIPFLGDHPFLAQFPIATALTHPQDYLLVAVLAVVAALLGQGFSKFLYLVEDVLDRLWGGRPEWARPAVGGLLVGAVLLALPQMYGVGYPVMFKALSGDYALWFLLVLVAGKILATSLTLGVGGSGGVFAPSLFIGLMTGTAFGIVVDHLFGAAAGDPALYAAMGMAGVFASATRAPLTALASIVEMTGDFALTLPVMLTVGIATAVSQGVSRTTVYTAKLLRRGQDLDRTVPWRVFTTLDARRTMRPLSRALPIPPGPHGAAVDLTRIDGVGSVVGIRDPQLVLESEPVTGVLRQLDAYGHEGLPVVSADGAAITGWVTSGSILAAVRGVLRPESDTTPTAVRAPDPLPGYRVLEVQVPASSPAVGSTVDDVAWPPGSVPVSLTRRGRVVSIGPAVRIEAEDVVHLLAREAAPQD